MFHQTLPGLELIYKLYEGRSINTVGFNLEKTYMEPEISAGESKKVNTAVAIV